MKARVLPGGTLPSKTRSQVEDFVRERVSVERDKQSREMADRILKVICIALNREFGFGTQRLARFLDKVYGCLKDSETDELYWWHTDGIVLDELKLPFHRENYDRLENRG